jgi:hypothetical protein
MVNQMPKITWSLKKRIYAGKRANCNKAAKPLIKKEPDIFNNNNLFAFAICEILMYCDFILFIFNFPFLQFILEHMHTFLTIFLQ